MCGKNRRTLLILVYTHNQNKMSMVNDGNVSFLRQFFLQCSRKTVRTCSEFKQQNFDVIKFKFGITGFYRIFGGFKPEKFRTTNGRTWLAHEPCQQQNKI